MQTSLKSFFISLYIWIFIVVTIIPLFILYFVIWMLVFAFDPRKKVTHFFSVWWTRLYLAINPGWKIRVENRERINPSKPYILLSNHQSIIDIALLLQICVNFKWVSKIELARFPFVGWVIWLNDHIVVRRGDKQSVANMAEACKRTLQQGVSVFMFPEGTRTRDGALLPFREGAFIMARDTEVPLLPIVIDGPFHALPKKGFWFRTEQVFTIRVLDEIEPETIRKLSLEQLIERTRKAMADALVDIRNPLKV
jgi:1-acyl-sn-glycerol-3-phosphate acyltransferase